MKKHRMKEVSLSEATKLRNGKFKAQSRPSKPWEKVTIVNSCLTIILKRNFRWVKNFSAKLSPYFWDSQDTCTSQLPAASYPPSCGSALSLPFFAHLLACQEPESLGSLQGKVLLFENVPLL